MTSTLRRNYGEVLLKRGAVLYHTSDTPFRLNDQKPMLFLTFHPTDWDIDEYNYITKITLKKDVSLLFMVDGIRGTRIHPLLDILINEPGNNLKKLYRPNQICYGRYLLREGFDGWFSTIDGKTTIEVGLLNIFDTYSYEPSARITYDWYRGRNYNMNTNMPKHWGTIYPIASPVLFRIHERYRKDIDTYLRLTNSVGPNEYTFQVLLNSAPIHYHDYPFQRIVWRCK